jgi:MtN3 and saliva related transmembrane protein
MNFIEIIGYVAMTFVMVAFLPQAYQVWKTKDVSGVSFATYLLLTISGLLWLVYGFLRQDYPIMFTNSILFIVQSSILYCKWKYSSK